MYFAPSSPVGAKWAFVGMLSANTTSRPAASFSRMSSMSHFNHSTCSTSTMGLASASARRCASTGWPQFALAGPAGGHLCQGHASFGSKGHVSSAASVLPTLPASAS